MNMGYQNTNSIRHPKRLFAPANEPYIAIRPMRPRYMELPRAKSAARRLREVRARPKGVAPC